MIFPRAFLFHETRNRRRNCSYIRYPISLSVISYIDTKRIGSRENDVDPELGIRNLEGRATCETRIGGAKRGNKGIKYEAVGKLEIQRRFSRVARLGVGGGGVGENHS